MAIPFTTEVTPGWSYVGNAGGDVPTVCPGGYQSAVATLRATIDNMSDQQFRESRIATKFILSWMAVGTTATLLSALAFALHEMLACRAMRAKAIPAE